MLDVRGEARGLVLELLGYVSEPARLELTVGSVVLVQLSS